MSKKIGNLKDSDNIGLVRIHEDCITDSNGTKITDKYQTKISSMLETNEKTVIVSINEINSHCNVFEKQNYKIVTPIMFGAVGDGKADDTKAVQDALNYFYNNSCKLIIDRVYNVVPQTMEDGSRVCIHLDGGTDNSSYSFKGEIDFQNAGRLKTTSDEECTLFRFRASNIKVRNIALSGVIDKTTLLELSKINKDDNDEYDSILFNSFVNGKFMYSKYAITMEGSCYYNDFNNLIFINCGRVLWLKPTKRALDSGVKESNVNRNYFSNFTANVGNKQGIYLEYGDTNKFTNISFEGLSDWCIYIKNYRIEYPKWYYTESNVFTNITFEACNKQIHNEVEDSQFYSVNYALSACEFIKTPMVLTNGLNLAYSPTKFYDYEVTTEESLTTGALKWTSLSNSTQGLGVRDLYDIDMSNGKIYQNHKRKKQGFDITQCINVESIKYNGNYNGVLTKSMGGIIFLQTKILITTIDTSKDIKLPYPNGLKCQSEQLAGWGNIVPFNQIAICNGNLIFVELTNSYIVLKKPYNNWENSVSIHLSLIYFREI